MDYRFRVTDLVQLNDGRAVVGVDFLSNGALMDSPDLWFKRVADAEAFFRRAQELGWTASEGVALLRGAEDQVVQSLAFDYGGDWW